MNTKEKTIIAIDPGANGAIAVYHYGTDSVTNYPMPETPKDIYDLLGNFVCNSICFLEQVHGMPGQAGGASFNFGKGFGHLEMALLALGIPVEMVTPQKWTKTMGLGTKSSCATASVWKNKLKAKAQQIYPNIKITLSNADALLILYYAMNQ